MSQYARKSSKGFVRLLLPQAMLALALASFSAWGANTTDTFDGGGTPFTTVEAQGPGVPLLMGGGPSGNFMRLATSGVPVGGGFITYDRTHVGTTAMVVADFDFRIGNPTGSGADGLGFALLNTANDGITGGVNWGAGEEPSRAGALGIGFDNFPNADVSDNSVSLHFNGVVIAEVDLNPTGYFLQRGAMAPGAAFDHAQLTVNMSAGTVSLTITNNSGVGPASIAVFVNTPVAGLAPYEWRAGFGARIGGDRTDQDIDNVNIRPAISVDAGADATINEGGTFNRSVSFVDNSGGTSWTATVDYGAGAGPQALGAVTSPFNISNTYNDNTVATVVVTVTSNLGVLFRGNDSVVVTVNNVAPTIAVSGAAAVNEGATYTVTLGAVTDPGTDTVSSYIVHWGDGNTDTYGTNGNKTHTYADGTVVRAITVDLVDEDGTFNNVGTALNVTVQNVNPAPVITGLPAPAGNGLLGQYYNVNPAPGFPPFAQPALQRVDATVDVDWLGGSPGPGIGADGFCVRWTGQVLTTGTAGNYQFQTVSDDGVRLFVNGALVISNWTDHGPTPNTSGLIPLAANTQYDIVLEFYENGGGAVIRLQWLPPGGGGFVAIPNGNLIQPSQGPEGTGIALNNTENDPAGANDTYTYDWHISKNGVADYQTSTAKNFTFTPNDNGVYVVTLTVNDEDGGSGPALRRTLVANNVAPSIAVSGAAAVDEGSSYTVTLGAVTDSGTDTVSSYVVHWGDGNTNTYGTSGNKTHTYADGPAVRAITVDLVDEDGTFLNVGTALSVTVNNVAPTLTLTGNATVNEGALYTLNLASSDPGTDTITEWEITWGDGNVQSIAGNPASATHTYVDGLNNYNITAKVKDDDSAVFYGTSNTLAITVNNVSPTVMVNAQADVTYGTASVTISGSFSDPGAAQDQNYSYKWRLQATTSELTAVEIPDASGTLAYTDPVPNFTVNLNYNDRRVAGSYTIELSITDDDVPANLPVTQTVQFDVLPLPVMVSTVLGSNTRIYGVANPSITAAINPDPLPFGQGQADLGTLTFSGVPTELTAIGSYTITPVITKTAPKHDNFQASYQSAVLTITRAGRPRRSLGN